MNINNSIKMNEINVNQKEAHKIKSHSEADNISKIAECSTEANASTANLRNNVSETNQAPRRVMRKVVIDPEKLKNLGLNRKIAKALGDGINAKLKTTIAKSDAVSVEIQAVKKTPTATKNTANKLINNTLDSNETTTTQSELKGVPGVFAKHRPELDYNLMTPNLRLLHAKNILQGHLLKKENNNQNNDENKNKKSSQLLSNNNNQKIKDNMNNKNNSSNITTAKLNNPSMAPAAENAATTTTVDHNYYTNNSNNSTSSISSISSISSSSISGNNNIDNNSYGSSSTSTNNTVTDVKSNDQKSINEIVEITNCEILVPAPTTTIEATSAPLSGIENVEYWNNEPQQLELSINIPQEQEQVEKQTQQSELNAEDNSEKCYVLGPQMSPLKMTFHKTKPLSNSPVLSTSTLNILHDNNSHNQNINIALQNNSNLSDLKSSLKKRKSKSKESKPIVLEHKILSSTEKFDISALNSSSTAFSYSKVLNNDILISNLSKINLGTHCQNLSMSINDMPFDIIPPSDNIADNQEPSIKIIEQNSVQNNIMEELPSTSKRQFKEENVLDDNETLNAVDIIPPSHNIVDNQEPSIKIIEQNSVQNNIMEELPSTSKRQFKEENVLDDNETLNAVDIIPPSHNIVDNQEPSIKIIEQNSVQNNIMEELPSTGKRQFKEENVLDNNETLNAVDFLASLSQASDFQGYELTEREKRKKARKSKNLSETSMTESSTAALSEPEIQPQKVENCHFMAINDMPIVLEVPTTRINEKQNDIFENVQEPETLADHELLNAKKEVVGNFVEKSAKTKKVESDMKLLDAFEEKKMEEVLLVENCVAGDAKKDNSLGNIDNELKSLVDALKPCEVENAVENGQEQMSNEVQVLPAQPLENKIEGPKKVLGEKRALEVKESFECSESNEEKIQSPKQIKMEIENVENSSNNFEKVKEVDQQENRDVIADKLQVAVCAQNNKTCQNNNGEIENNTGNEEQQGKEEVFANSNNVSLKKQKLAEQKSNFNDHDDGDYDDANDTDELHITDDASPIEDDDYNEIPNVEKKYKTEQKKGVEEAVKTEATVDLNKFLKEEEEEDKEEIDKNEKERKDQIKKVDMFVKSPRKQRRASALFLANLKSAKLTKQNRINSMRERKEKKKEEELKMAEKKDNENETRNAELKTDMELESEVEIEHVPKPELVIMTTIVKKSERIRSRTNNKYINNNNNNKNINNKSNNRNINNDNNNKNNNNKNINNNKNNPNIAKKEVQSLTGIEKDAEAATAMVAKENENNKEKKSLRKEMSAVDEKPVKIVEKIITRKTTMNNNENNNIDLKKNKHRIMSNEENEEVATTSVANVNHKLIDFENHDDNNTKNKKKKKRKSKNKTIPDFFNKTPPSSRRVDSSTPTSTDDAVHSTVGEVVAAKKAKIEAASKATAVAVAAVANTTTATIAATTIAATVATTAAAAATATINTRKRGGTRLSHVDANPSTAANEVTPSVPPKKRIRKSKTPTTTSESPATITSPCIPPQPVLPMAPDQNTSSGAKKRGRKPKNAVATTAVASTSGDSTSAVSEAVASTSAAVKTPKLPIQFNPRLLLIRNREQLDTDEILTATVEQPNNENNEHNNNNNNNNDDNSDSTKDKLEQCGVCLAYITRRNWIRHKGEHYGVGWLVGSKPINIQLRSQVLSAMLNYFKDTETTGLNCRMCNRIYRSALGLLTHLEHCGAEIERLPCPNCGKNLSKASMTVHLRNCVINKNMLEDEARARRFKRASTIKAEQQLKDCMSTNDPCSRWVQYVPDWSWSKAMEAIRLAGKIVCVHDEKCGFEANNGSTLFEHYVNCEYARAPGYHCKLCFKGVYNYKELQPFETEQLAIEHLKVRHPRLRLDSGSDFENKNHADDGSDDDELIPFINLKDGEIVKSSTKSYANKKRPVIAKNSTSLWFTRPRMFPNRSHNPNALACKRWYEFKKSNYSLTSLFDFGKVSYRYTPEFPLDPMLPSGMTSMKFAFSKDSAPVKKLGMQLLPENLQQLQRFESANHDDEYIMYLGGSVVHMEWVPLPNSKLEQYLCISYRMHDKTVKLIGPQKCSDCIIVYKVKTPLHHGPPILEHMYALHIENGPVHCFSFLPSGGYDEANNRLGLIAVGTVEHFIRIFAIPLELDKEQPSDGSLLIINVPPVIVLVTLENPLTSKESKVIITAQCLTICWSDFKNHNIIAAGFSNGYIGIWDIEKVKKAADQGEQGEEDDFDQINTNVYYKNDILHVKPVTYFFTGEKVVRCLALHYDESHGVRWLATTTWSRHFIVYDIVDLTKPILIKQLSTSSLITDINWSPIWESLMLAYHGLGPQQKNSDIAAAYSPTSLLYTRSRVDSLNSSLTQVQYNPECNLHAFACDNGDIVLIETREMYLEEVSHRDPNRVPRAISTLDLVQVNGEPLAFPTTENVNGKTMMEESPMLEENYMEKYALIFKKMATYQPAVHKNYMNAERQPHFFHEHMMRISVMRFNFNSLLGKDNLLAVGHENGFVRVFHFNKRDYFK